ncbi:hypothetical protein H7X46_07460 [Pseudonocardia sp. C8]|uniref:hypothetical protein n=1 Tax=Pseudonocardia sp. C8 TaxID=2762759 RepID=UPI0016426C1C|nr:hypothetical protein [Pseudonocardia sp. C8]MBC3190898.1 hypothetical protein [Pseudonocardia sp. C8]
MPAVRAERSLRVARAEPEPGPRRGGVCARGALPGGPARPAAVWRGGPAPTPGGGASAVREGRESRVVRVVRPASRRCLVAVARRRGRSGVRPRGERLLAGAAAVLCSATVVLLLGLLGDAAAGWNAGSAVPSEGSAPVLVVDR